MSDPMIETSVRLAERLEDQLPDEQDLEFHFAVDWGKSSQRRRFDIVISKYSRTNFVAVIELRRNDNIISSAIFKYRDYVYNYTPAKLFIVYCVDTDKFRLYTKDTTDVNPIVSLDDIIHAIRKAANNIYKSDSFTDFGLKFYEGSTNKLDPIWCRKKLGRVSCDQICRYSSLDSLFWMLKTRKMRMNGLPGMNDRNEGLFAWNLIYKDNVLNESFKESNREINNAFIVSYSSEDLIDNLTQWRLYGDDAKGVCCVYRIQNRKLNNTRFFIHRVRYINRYGIDEHGNNDKLLKMCSSFRNDRIKHNDYDYYDFSPLIFFYKSDSFKSEDEVRLLVDNRDLKAYDSSAFEREWVLTHANSIPNPYIDIPIESIPLKLEQIILGPNMNDVDTIQAQLETMLKQHGFEVTVKLSDIDSYRNPTN